jgi:hypothetical protein
MSTRKEWVSAEVFRDTASRQDLLDFFADYISDRGGSLRSAVPLELVLALLKVKSINFGKLVNLIFVEISIDALFGCESRKIVDASLRKGPM